MQRVLRDVEAERPFLELQELRLLELACGDRGWCLGVLAVSSPPRSKIEACPASRSAALLPPRERLLEQDEHPHSGGAGRVERAALDQRLERALVHDLAGRRARRSPRSTRTGRSSRAATIEQRYLLDRLDRVQAEADLPWTTAKSVCEVLTSGGTSIPSSSQAFTYSGTLSFVLITDEISRHVLARGWFAFSQAVR